MPPIRASNGIKALAHITGGGLLENIPRILPDNLRVDLDTGSWEAPAIFAWLAEHGPVAKEEMWRTFNCGIGMTLIVAPDAADAVKTILTENGETVYTIGTVSSREDTSQEQVCIHG